MSDLTNKEAILLQQFQNISKEELYERLINLGKTLPPLPSELKTESNRVVGCQSLLYCAVFEQAGHIRILLDADALISKGLAALVYHLYDGVSPQEILTIRPTLFQKIDLLSSLSMTRLNGLQSLLKHVIQKILKKNSSFQKN